MIDSERLYTLARRLEDASDILRFNHRTEDDIRRALGIVIETTDQIAAEAAAMLRYELERDRAEKEMRYREGK